MYNILLITVLVPRKVLREPYDNRLEDDNVDGDIEDPDYDIDYGTIGDTVIYRDRGSDSSYSPSPKLSAPNISGNTSLLLPPPSHISPSTPHNEINSKGNLFYYYLIVYCTSFIVYNIFYVIVFSCCCLFNVNS